MTLTKKHFEAIAKLIKFHLADNFFMEIERPLIKQFIISLSDYFKTENPYFDRERFLKACGVQE